MAIDQHIKDWCYAECERQHATTPADIAGMEEAWQYASDMNPPLTITDIKIMAGTIDPIANPGGRFRTGPAVFMDGGRAASADEIEWRLEQLFHLISGMGPIGEFDAGSIYRELMYIHPFKDGNGRVGALVYNILNGTIDNPIVPPPYKEN
jgi:hypothetical protein